MAIPVSELKEVSLSLAQKLDSKGIVDSGQRVGTTKSPAESVERADPVEVELRAMLEFANRADRSRLNGVAGVFSDLLEQVGVDTLQALTAGRPENLHARVAEVDSAHPLSDRTPSPAIPTLALIEEWLDQAKAMPEMLTC